MAPTGIGSRYVSVRKTRSPATARERQRYVLITHDNDGVADFGLDLLAEAPDWLGPAETRPAGVPKAEQWQSPTTFVQTLIDMKNSANEIPGKFEGEGPRLPGRPRPVHSGGIRPAGQR